MDEIGDFFYSRIQSFNAQNQTNRECLEHPFRGSNVKIKACQNEQHANGKLHHHTVLGRYQFHGAFEREAHAFQSAGKKRIVLLKFHVNYNEANALS